MARCSTRPVLVMTTSSTRDGVRATSSTWRTLDRISDGILHDRDLAGQLREQPHRAPDDVVEVDGAVEEALDRPPLSAGERLDRRELVDEQAVALVGGDPARAGVRLSDVALVLERRHVIADRRRRDTQVVAVDERLGPHGLLGGDVVLDDGAQHFELAVLEQRCTPPVGIGRLALTRAECQVYDGGHEPCWLARRVERVESRWSARLGAREQVRRRCTDRQLATAKGRAGDAGCP